MIASTRITVCVSLSQNARPLVQYIIQLGKGRPAVRIALSRAYFATLF